MADQHANPVDEPLDDAHMIGTGLAMDINGAAAFIPLIPTLEALVADLRRLATGHTAVSTTRVRARRPYVVPARASRGPDRDAAASPTSRKRKRVGKRPLLTRREAEVLGLTTAGQRAAEIAEQLHIAVGTVYVHRRNARRKLREHATHRSRTLA